MFILQYCRPFLQRSSELAKRPKTVRSRAALNSPSALANKQGYQVFTESYQAAIFQRVPRGSMKNLSLSAAAVLSLTVVAAPAQAGVLLDFTATTTGQIQVNQTDGTDGNVRTFTVAGQFTVNASAWTLSTTGSTTNLYKSFLGLYTPGQPGYDAGLGVTNRFESGTSPTHTIDNSSDGTHLDKDFVLLQFDRKVNLTQAWLDAYGDTDLSIGYANPVGPLGWDGTSYTASTFAPFTFYDQTNTGNADGWYNIAPNGGVMASTWIVAALAPTNSNTAVDRYADLFKLTAIKVNTAPAVPEPATWAMMIVGFGAIGGLVRRDKKLVQAMGRHA